MAYLALSPTNADAVPPPPVPPQWTEPANNIARIAGSLSGDWRAMDPTSKDWTVELRVGRFGNSANPYLLIGRVVHIPQGGGFQDVPVSSLWVLTYDFPCHAFAMLSLDRLAREGAALDCPRTFPIAFRDDGTLGFSYLDETGSERVDVSVNGDRWTETTVYPARYNLKPRVLDFHRAGKAVGWGVVR